MSRLTPVSWRAFVKRRQELGFEGPYPGGNHPLMRREDVRVAIPNPHRDISVDLLGNLLFLHNGRLINMSHTLNISKSELKELIRETMITVLDERENWLEEVVTDAILDMKLALAIEEGDAEEFVPEAEILNKLRD